MLKKIACVCLSLSFLASCGGGKNNSSKSDESSSSKKSDAVLELEHEIALEKTKGEESRKLEKLRAELAEIREKNKSPEERKRDKFREDFKDAQDVIGFSVKSFSDIAKGVKDLADTFSKNKSSNSDSFGFGSSSSSSKNEDLISKASDLVDSWDTEKEGELYSGTLKQDIADTLISADYFSSSKSSRSKDYILRTRGLSSLGEIRKEVSENTETMHFDLSVDKYGEVTLTLAFK